MFGRIDVRPGVGNGPGLSDHAEHRLEPPEECHARNDVLIGP